MWCRRVTLLDFKRAEQTRPFGCSSRIPFITLTTQPTSEIAIVQQGKTSPIFDQTEHCISHSEGGGVSGVEELHCLNNTTAGGCGSKVLHSSRIFDGHRLHISESKSLKLNSRTAISNALNKLVPLVVDSMNNAQKSKKITANQLFG